ncbi:MAG: CHAT domain-containing protein [Candidatus Melainabacteria bacterium]|nr:CHAT domain-containing protein [Candidatus Melainabacteria bacterium]MBI3307930.1 CHAT domain-containing protein [Candidatus Melainabacteria bacterium]
MQRKFKNIILGHLALLMFCIFALPPQAIAEPIITEIVPNSIAQGQTVNAIVSGSNLNDNIAAIGFIGNGVSAVVLHSNPDGTSLTVQFIAQSNAEVGQKSFFIGTLDGKNTAYPINVTYGDLPSIAIIYPNSASPGETKFIQVAGTGLTNIASVRTSNEFDLKVNSFRFYPNGNILDLSISVDPNAVAPATHEVFIETLTGQQTKTYFSITKSDFARISNGESYSDPFSPGIYEVSVNPTNQNQIILKGAMFNPDAFNNIVTILENVDGTVTSRQVTVNYANNNELIIDLPENIKTDQIGIAVSNEGKSSNIKSVELDALLNPIPNNNDTATQTINSITSVTDQNIDDPTDELLAYDSMPEPPPAINIEPIENIDSVGTLQPLAQVLFTDNKDEILEDQINEAALKNSENPEELISKIEENKQVKEQSELIELALKEAKKAHDKELQETLNKAEELKAQVNDLESLLDEEKKKHKPDRRKLEKYMKLLASANAESRSQTFALLNNLLKYKPQLKASLIQKPFDLAAIQPNIPDDSAIIQYVPTEEGLIVFVVDNKNLKTRISRDISKEIIDHEVKAFRQLFENEIEKIKETGRVTPIKTWKKSKSKAYKEDILPIKERSIFLYNTLIKPIEKDIAAKKTLAVIANGWLRYLPFQALATPTQDGDLHFLASDKSIVYLDSVLALSKNSTSLNTDKTKVAVLANPDGTLSGADEEAKIINELFGMSAISLVNKPFNKDIINDLSKKSDILHLATHGHFDGSDISSSFLLTGKVQVKKKTVEEKLKLSDIYDLNLKNSKLIVLSGCDTGKIGNLENEPDDVVGSLATAFRVAGANTILASLWKAHDEATKILMENFYKNIKSGMSKADALRVASLKVKQNPKYGHPLFWSLFSLIGDWR